MNLLTLSKEDPNGHSFLKSEKPFFYLATSINSDLEAKYMVYKIDNEKHEISFLKELKFNESNSIEFYFYHEDYIISASENFLLIYNIMNNWVTSLQINKKSIIGGKIFGGNFGYIDKSDLVYFNFYRYIFMILEKIYGLRSQKDKTPNGINFK